MNSFEHYLLYMRIFKRVNSWRKEEHHLFFVSLVFFLFFLVYLHTVQKTEILGT